MDVSEIEKYLAAAERLGNSKMTIFAPLHGDYQVTVRFGQTPDYERATGQAIGWICDIDLLVIAVERMAKALGYE